VKDVNELQWARQLVSRLGIVQPMLKLERNILALAAGYCTLSRCAVGCWSPVANEPRYPDTLLLFIRRRQEQQQGDQRQQHTDHTLRVIEIDDWAKRKGQAYAAIFCDLENGAAVDLVPDRGAVTLAEWLRALADADQGAPSV
jgi:hypothetical protein